MQKNNAVDMLLNLVYAAMSESDKKEVDTAMLGIEAALDGTSNRAIRDMAMMRTVNAWREEHRPTEAQLREARNSPIGKMLQAMEMMNQAEEALRNER